MWRYKMDVINGVGWTITNMKVLEIQSGRQLQLRLLKRGRKLLTEHVLYHHPKFIIGITAQNRHMYVPSYTGFTMQNYAELKRLTIYNAIAWLYQTTRQIDKY